MLKSSTLAWTLLLLVGGAAAEAPYTNPVIGRPGMHAEVPDPFVLKWNGEYFLYTSGDPITAYHSRDLANWTFIGPVLASSKDPNAWNQADVWAPEVTYRNGKFYLYYTATRKSDDWRVMERERRVGVAISDSPRGPFVDSGKPLSCDWAIDGHVFRDPQSGEDFFFYSHLDEERLRGAGMAVDRMVTPTRLACKPALVIQGSEPWEDKDGDPDNGSVRYTNEAPTVLKRDGRFFVMYSGGSWDLPTYALGYAVSGQVLTGDLRGPGWRKVIPPILRSTPLVEGPGHNSVTKAPNNVDDINIYHARAVPFFEPWNRMPFVDRLYWHLNRLFTPAPSTGRQAPPDRPLFAARGPGDARLAATLRNGNGRAIVPSGPRLSHFVMEVNLKLLASATPMSSAGSGQPASAGAIVFDDGRDQLRVGIEQAHLTFRGELGGQPVVPQVRELPPDFVRDGLHQLLITRNGPHFRVTLDGIELLSGEFPVAHRAAGFGLFGSAQPVEFEYWAVTHFFEDSFSAADSGWQDTSGDWSVNGGVFLQRVASGRHIASKGPAAQDFEFSAGVRMQQFGEQALTGVAVTGENQSVVAGFDHHIWPFARFRIRKLAAGVAKDEIAIPMPRGFRYDQFHTIRVAKYGNGLTFWLDGAEVAALRTDIRAGRPGLMTENAAAAFDDIRWKQIVARQSFLLNGSFETEQWNESKPAQGNPWQTSGTAREHYCCAHSGLRRLLITAGKGAARQSISGLPAGEYTLYAHAIASGSTATRIAVEGAAIPAATTVRGQKWTAAALRFAVNPADTVTVVISAAPKDGDWAAVDDVYLARTDQSPPRVGNP